MRLAPVRLAPVTLAPVRLALLDCPTLDCAPMIARARLTEVCYCWGLLGAGEESKGS